MRANRIPRADRLRRRICNLHMQYDQSRVKTPGNPYMKCTGCGIRDPELSIRDGKHRWRCQKGGLLKQIAYYERLLSEELERVRSTT